MSENVPRGCGTGLGGETPDPPRTAFATYTRQASPPRPRSGPGDLCRRAALFRANWREGQQLRLLGVGVSGLRQHAGYQLDLFDRSDQRRTRLNRTLDAIRERYGQAAITRASLLKRPSQEE